MTRSLAARIVPLCLVFAATATSGRAQPAAPADPAGRSATFLPKAFGTASYSVTSVTATAFVPGDSATGFHTSGSLGRFGNVNTHSEFFAAVDVPAGAIIDYIGLNSTTDTPAALTATLYVRGNVGNASAVGSVSSTVHPSGWEMDFNASPIGFTWYGLDGETLILKVDAPALPTMQFFGFVTVVWRRTVSAAPSTATFADVPKSSPIFQFVEALADSGITAGCGGGNFCPNNPVTRGQMAVFLAKALGLNWAGNAILPPPANVDAETAR